MNMHVDMDVSSGGRGRSRSRSTSLGYLSLEALDEAHLGLTDGQSLTAAAAPFPPQRR